MHPRIGLHQVAMMDVSTGEFIAHCRAVGVGHMTLVTPKLFQEGELDGARAELAKGGPKATIINHPFATFPNLEEDTGEAASALDRAISVAEALDAKAIYLLTGGRGSLDWEAAASKFAALIQPGIIRAKDAGIKLLVENASAFNADIHIAHTLPDTITLAETAGIGVCIDLVTCWHEGGLSALFARALPITGLVQVSDYVLGDRTAPCRAVPGDGAVPLTRMIGQLLNLGYKGVFDIELIGPRITAEGGAVATARAASALTAILENLGA